MSWTSWHWLATRLLWTDNVQQSAQINTAEHSTRHTPYNFQYKPPAACVRDPACIKQCQVVIYVLLYTVRMISNTHKRRWRFILMWSVEFWGYHILQLDYRKKRRNKERKWKTKCLSCQIFTHRAPMLPHHGLPPCHGGGAYAPMTRTIFNLKEGSQPRADRMIGTTILHVTSPRWLVICLASQPISASQPITVTLWLHRGCALGLTDTVSALGRCNNLPTPKVR